MEDEGGYLTPQEVRARMRAIIALTESINTTLGLLIHTPRLVDRQPLHARLHDDITKLRLLLESTSDQLGHPIDPILDVEGVPI